MRELRTEIEIAAPVSKVWSILTDFDRWKDWNPISEASGVAALGSQLTVTMRGKEGKGGMEYRPIVINIEPPRLFRWRGKMMFEFLMTNDKVFELEEMGSGTRLIHRELFGGLLVPLFWTKLNQGALPMLKTMNDALKTIAEKRSDS